MILLDYKLDPSHVNRLTNQDIISATHTTLDYYLFCGDIHFRVNGANLDAQWGLIPVLSFSMRLCEIVCTIRDGEMSRLEFTDSDNEIRFLRTKDVINMSCDYSDACAQTSLSEVRSAGVDFTNRVFDDLSNRWPSLKSNKAFQEKLDQLVLYSKHRQSWL